MRITGLEPARHGHQNLNLARLPIPPYPHRIFLFAKESPNLFRFELSSEASGIRTPDNLIKSQVLYHLSYTPIFLPGRPMLNWASWIRTSECRCQSPVPYRLAIAQDRLTAKVDKGIRTLGLQSHNLAR